MKVLNSKHKKQSAAITAGILLLIILAIFNLGLDYLDPPAEYGVAINYGDAVIGSGVPVEAKKSSQKKSSVSEIENIQEVSEEVVAEALLTSDASDAVPVLKKVAIKKTAVPEVRTEKKQLIRKPSKENQAALDKLLSGTRAERPEQGAGPDAVAGTKGVNTGVAETAKYYGNTGIASNGNYNLAGRKVLETPKKQPNCQEEGIVVVQITVDKKGNVLSAIPGVKGTTNTAPCLAKPAKEAALSTRWNVDTEAPAIQTGTIIYKFSLSK